jgi:hypothetical protein
MGSYEGIKMIKTFRGTVEEKINLKTIRGEVGYRIVKFQIMGHEPGVSVQESVVLVWKKEQSTVTGAIDFTDVDLLGAAVLQMHDSSAYQFTTDVIFDKEIFNQDIFITHKDVDGTRLCNYYLELEEVKLDLNQNTVATLKDIRNHAQ